MEASLGDQGRMTDFLPKEILEKVSDPSIYPYILKIFWSKLMVHFLCI